MALQNVDFVTKVLVTVSFFDNGQLWQNRFSDNGSGLQSFFSLFLQLIVFLSEIFGKKYFHRGRFSVFFAQTIFCTVNFFSMLNFVVTEIQSGKEKKSRNTLLEMKAGEQLKPVVGGGEGAAGDLPTPQKV